ncbi:MAG: hypothetical protein KFF72_02145 [Arthrospira sp. SH-MAG29]|nr:hypothetical protein [Arthrospira sp. SH-MAG29]MBS0015169.1 hypothetical protein [Arthrospira sp. SH-MAG29]
MVKQEQTKFRTIQLTEGVLVSTPIEEFCIPALRAGFSGYPVNPRWSGVKFHAWKIGRQMREDLSKGILVVRTADSMLVLAENEANQETTETPSTSQKSGLMFSTLFRRKKRELTPA